MLYYVRLTKKYLTEPNSFNLKSNELCKIIQGRFVHKTDDLSIATISIDSRTAMGQPNEVFFALRGNHLDGHTFIEDLYKKGTRNFVVSQALIVPIEANVILVENVLQALQKIAQHKRESFGGRVVGITGSNGKTIVKEWLATILETSHAIVKSPGSYNSQIGVALSVWQLNDKTDLGIFEAGISKPNEMSTIGQIIQPELGVFTNIGTAHQENFESLEDKICEKLKLFKNCDHLILRADHEGVITIAKREYKGNLIPWSFSSKDEGIIKVARTSNGIQFKLDSRTYEIEAPFQDDGSLENLTHAALTAAFLGLSEKLIQEGVKNIQPLKMRLKVAQGINGNYIVDDSYTNDLAGLVKALDFMEKQNLHKSKVIILSDFGSSYSVEQYNELAKLLNDKVVDHFIGIGPAISALSEHISISSKFFDSTGDFLDRYPLDSLRDRLVLVKGSRKFQFERIVNRLSQRTHKTSLEINLDSVVKNLSTYRNKLKSDTKIMVMVKALAYGAGSFEMAKILEYHKVDYLAVAYTDEGKELREKGISLPIMVMNPSLNDGPTLAKYNLEPEVFSCNQIKSFIQDFRFVGKKLPIHIILNTGMNRLGFEEEDIPSLNALLSKENDIEVKSIFTHLAAADENEHDLFTQGQIERFQRLSPKVKFLQLTRPLYHVLNSSGIISYPLRQMDMVRLGIGLYGLDPTGTIQEDLVYPSTFKTTISQIRGIKKGESIGYGRNGKANNDSQIATIAVGYADGYSRRFGNGKAKVSINGQLAPTIGNICMDMSMVDVTDIDAKVGDEVILFGSDPTIKDLAQIAETIPYEILTNVSSRVSRVFFAE